MVTTCISSGEMEKIIGDNMADEKEIGNNTTEYKLNIEQIMKNIIDLKSSKQNGGSNEHYYKYIKYKTKYMNLKNQ